MYRKFEVVAIPAVLRGSLARPPSKVQVSSDQTTKAVEVSTRWIYHRSDGESLAKCEVSPTAKDLEVEPRSVESIPRRICSTASDAPVVPPVANCVPQDAKKKDSQQTQSGSWTQSGREVNKDTRRKYLLKQTRELTRDNTNLLSEPERAPVSKSSRRVQDFLQFCEPATDQSTRRFHNSRTHTTRGTLQRSTG